MEKFNDIKFTVATLIEFLLQIYSNKRNKFLMLNFNGILSLCFLVQYCDIQKEFAHTKVRRRGLLLLAYCNKVSPYRSYDCPIATTEQIDGFLLKFGMNLMLLETTSSV
jgi:predicted DNA-binding protein YlxM (UPF0122 family)